MLFAPVLLPPSLAELPAAVTGVAPEAAMAVRMPVWAFMAEDEDDQVEEEQEGFKTVDAENTYRTEPSGAAAISFFCHSTRGVTPPLRRHMRFDDLLAPRTVG